ncbi:hypothetical protein, partial [Streptomyces sp. SID161]|uniref:hypothetical protein n=1 Tax=Streptomyces sp. SID161 TaxID=2690251 RepID=UPI001F169BDF
VLRTVFFSAAVPAPPSCAPSSSALPSLHRRPAHRLLQRCRPCTAVLRTVFFSAAVPAPPSCAPP